MVDAEASQPGNGLSLYQILQTDGALSAVFTEHIRCKRKHRTTVSFSSLFKTATDAFRWHDTYYCKVGEETWGSSTGDPQCDPQGKASSRKDSGYLHRAEINVLCNSEI